jgi:hypothetical protein
MLHAILFSLSIQGPSEQSTITYNMHNGYIYTHIQHADVQILMRQQPHQTHVLIIFPSRQHTGISSKPTHASTPAM